MRRRLWFFVAVLLFSGLMLPGVRAEQSNLDAVKLSDIVVTATKTEKTLEDAPGSVTVIKGEDLKKQNITTVDDALSSLSGAFVKRTKGLMDSTPSLRMRGFSGDQYTLILMDGQPLNDAYTGGVEWGLLPVDNIERIEVLRGPASALYGSNAMGGVVNIITKTPDKLVLEAGGGYGTNNTRRYRLNAGNRFGDRLSMRVGYEEENTDGYAGTPVLNTISSGTGTVAGGYPMDDKYGDPTKWVVGDKGDNGAQRRSINGKISLDFSDTGEISFSGTSGRHEYDYGRPHTCMGTYGDDTTYAIAGDDLRARFRPNDFINYTGIGKNETDTLALSLKDIFGPVQFNAQVGTIKADDRYTLESGSGMPDYNDSPGTLKITENESWFSEFRGSMDLGITHTLTLGTSYRQDSSDTDDYTIPFYRSYSGKGASTFYSGGKSKAWAVFAQDEWRMMDPLTFYLGVRFDSWKVYDGKSGEPGSQIRYDSNRESEVSPKVAAVWKALADTTVRASVGHAFRPPTLYELYRTWESYGTTYESNSDLKPETVWTYEMGIDQYFFDKKTRLSLTGYRNDTEDLIYYQVDGSTKKRTNAGEARTYGIELEASQKVTDWLSLWANFTYTDAEITDSPTDQASEGKQVAGIPERTFNIGADAAWGYFKGSIVGRYYSKIYNDSDNKDKAEGVYGTYEPAFMMDAKLTLAPTKWMEVSFSIDNLFDENYYEYYELDGRTIFGEITLRY